MLWRVVELCGVVSVDALESVLSVVGAGMVEADPEGGGGAVAQLCSHSCSLSLQVECLDELGGPVVDQCLYPVQM